MNSEVPRDQRVVRVLPKPPSRDEGWERWCVNPSLGLRCLSSLLPNCLQVSCDQPALLISEFRVHRTEGCADHGLGSLSIG